MNEHECEDAVEILDDNLELSEENVELHTKLDIARKALKRVIAITVVDTQVYRNLLEAYENSAP